MSKSELIAQNQQKMLDIQQEVLLNNDFLNKSLDQQTGDGPTVFGFGCSFTAPANSWVNLIIQERDNNLDQTKPKNFAMGGTTTHYLDHQLNQYIQEFGAIIPGASYVIYFGPNDIRVMNDALTEVYLAKIDEDSTNAAAAGQIYIMPEMQDFITDPTNALIQPLITAWADFYKTVGGNAIRRIQDGGGKVVWIEHPLDNHRQTGAEWLSVFLKDIMDTNIKIGIDAHAPHPEKVVYIDLEPLYEKINIHPEDFSTPAQMLGTHNNEGIIDGTAHPTPHGHNIIAKYIDSIIDREYMAEQEAQEAQRLAAEQEAARLQAEQAEIQRLAAEQEAARLQAEQAEIQRLAAEQEAARLQAEQAEIQRLAAEQEAARLQAEQAEIQRLAAEQEAARLQAEQAEIQRLAAEQEAARLQAEQAEIQRLAAEQEATRLQAEQAEIQRLAAEQEAARLQAEQAEIQRLAAEQEASRLQAEQAEIQRLAAEQEATRLQAEQDTPTLAAQRMFDEENKSLLATKLELETLAAQKLNALNVAFKTLAADKAANKFAKFKEAQAKLHAADKKIEASVIAENNYVIADTPPPLDPAAAKKIILTTKKLKDNANKATLKANSEQTKLDNAKKLADNAMKNASLATARLAEAEAELTKATLTLDINKHQYTEAKILADNAAKIQRDVEIKKTKMNDTIKKVHAKVVFSTKELSDAQKKLQSTAQAKSAAQTKQSNLTNDVSNSEEATAIKRAQLETSRQAEDAKKQAQSDASARQATAKAVAINAQAPSKNADKALTVFKQALKTVKAVQKKITDLKAKLDAANTKAEDDAVQAFYLSISKDALNASNPTPTSLNEANKARLDAAKKAQLATIARNAKEDADIKKIQVDTAVDQAQLAVTSAQAHFNAVKQVETAAKNAKLDADRQKATSDAELKIAHLVTVKDKKEFDKAMRTEKSTKDAKAAADVKLSKLAADMVKAEAVVTSKQAALEAATQSEEAALQDPEHLNSISTKASASSIHAKLTLDTLKASLNTAIKDKTTATNAFSKAAASKVKADKDYANAEKSVGIMETNFYAAAKKVEDVASTYYKEAKKLHEPVPNEQAPVDIEDVIQEITSIPKTNAYNVNNINVIPKILEINNNPVNVVIDKLPPSLVLIGDNPLTWVQKLVTDYTQQGKTLTNLAANTNSSLTDQVTGYVNTGIQKNLTHIINLNNHEAVINELCQALLTDINNYAISNNISTNLAMKIIIETMEAKIFTPTFSASLEASTSIVSDAITNLSQSGVKDIIYIAPSNPYTDNPSHTLDHYGAWVVKLYTDTIKQQTLDIPGVTSFDFADHLDFVTQHRYEVWPAGDTDMSFHAFYEPNNIQDFTEKCFIETMIQPLGEVGG